MLICPVCGGGLERSDRSFLCKAGHCYDIAKSGYVNLLMSQKSSARNHGDDREMLRARREFLDKGYYEPLRNALCDEIGRSAPENAVILDCGCGEGYYTGAFAGAAGSRAKIFAVDISKDAAAYAAKRCPDVCVAAASAYRLPLADASCDIVLSVFAPYSEAELLRVLRPDGVLIEAAPMPMHLMNLKRAVYDKTYENEAPPLPHGFCLERRRELVYNLSLESGGDIRRLFLMTPYSRKTSPSDTAKLEALDRLTVSAEFYISVYKPNSKEY